jgi:uncharacterized membrane protein YdcZ (DUF606 family)
VPSTRRPSQAIDIDRLGVLGLEPTPVTASRVIGVELLLVGTHLVVR